MPGLALVRLASTLHPARQQVRAEAPRVEPEHVEEVWDAELVGDAATPAWLAGPACSSYLRSGLRAAPRRIDVYA